MSIRKKSFISQVRPRQNKSVKHTPISEGGLGLTPRTDGGSVDDDIKKAKENKLAQYWYDKYENLVKEVSYERKLDRQNLSELDEKLDGVNQGLLNEISVISDNDPLVDGEQKFVTFEKLSEHNRVMFGRLQKQMETIGGGGIGKISDDPSPQIGANLDLNSQDITGTGNITHTGNITTTGNSSISGTLGVQGVTTVEEDVIFTGANTNMRWDHSTSDLKLFDNTRLEFGSNKDFEIWHGGAHTFMKNSGGDLRIRGDVLKFQREDSSETYIECNVNNAVQIFHNGTEKFTTTSTGVTITGDAKVGTSQSAGVILTSPNGTEYRIVVADDGTLSTSSV